MTVALAVVGALAGVAALAMTMMIAAAVVREDAAQAAGAGTMTRSPGVDVVATKAVDVRTAIGPTMGMKFPSEVERKGI